MTLALRKSRVHYCGVMHFCACSSLMSVTLPAEAGCETSERIVLKLAFISLQQHSNKGSLKVTGVSVLPHVTVERRHLWQVMQRDNDY